MSLQERTQFPRGLEQPTKGFRFSTDALLLACFCPVQKGTSVIDLGTGCGVIGLGIILRNLDTPPSVTGIELDEDMVRCARSNISRLQLEEIFSILPMDVADIRKTRACPPESFDLALINPPYRDPKSGRTPAHYGKHRARFEGKYGLDVFLDATAYALKNKGRLCMVYLAQRLAELMIALETHGLEPKRMRLVHSRWQEGAKLVLLETRKNSRPGLEVEPPLVLYQGEGEETQLTEQALRFCPFLARTPQRG